MMNGLALGRVLVIAGLLVPSPIVWAQALEVADVETTRAAVETQIDRLVTELATRDPELAQEVERQTELCVRDLSDGRLESPEFTKEIETYRDVQRDLAERVVQGEMETRIAEATASGNRELAESMRTAFEAFQGVGGGETINRDDAKKMFEQAYNETLTHDPEGAQHMKEMFEAAERGEFVRPTPEMMERMREEMGEYLRENPEMREYAAVEWDRMMEHGMDQGERFGPTESPEQAREAFERWSSESGANQADIDRMRAEMEHGFEMGREMMERGMPEGMQHEFERGTDMAREFERWTEGRDPTEVEHYREMMERDNSAILDNRAEFLATAPPPPEGGGGSHVLKEMHTVEMNGHAEGHWDGNGDGIEDHTHTPETMPH